MKTNKLMTGAMSLMLMLAAVGCQPDDPKPEGSGSTPVEEQHNPLAGHTWQYYFDGDMAGHHVVIDEQYAFLTDSTGKYHMSMVAEGAPEQAELTLQFVYSFDESNGEIEYLMDNSSTDSADPGYLYYDFDTQTITDPRGSVEYVKIS